MLRTMYLSDFRRLVARPLFHMTEAQFRVYQTKLSVVEQLKPLDLKPGTRGGGLAIVTPATPSNCALLMIGAMIGNPNVSLGERVWRRWAARATIPCKVTGKRAFGEALAALLGSLDLAERIDGGTVEVTKEFAAGRLLWPDRTTSEFIAGTDAHEWRVRMDAANSRFGIGMLSFALLPGSAAAQIARLLVSDPPPPRVGRGVPVSGSPTRWTRATATRPAASAS